MTDMQNTMKSTARLVKAYLAHPYTGSDRSPERYQRRPEYYDERHRLIVKWTSSSKEARVAAELSMRFEGLINKAPIAIDGEELRRPKINDDVALRLLCQTVSWPELTPNKASAVAKDILTFLGHEKYKVSARTPTDVIATYEILTKQVAHQATQALIKLQGTQSLCGSLEKGLLKALNAWTQRQAYGAILPEELRKLRKRKSKTQQEITDILDITLRQYARYEHGGTPVPEAVVAEIHNLPDVAP